MPATHYTIRWPDAREAQCYSPSLIVQEVLEAGRDYPLADFLERMRRATAIANDRVQAKYGFLCTRASAQLDVFETEAQRYAGLPDARVRVLSFSPAD